MFDALASKIGEAQQAFADGLGNLDALNMDRLREEEERNQNAQREGVNRENARERASITDGENNNLRREKGSSSLIDHPPLSGGGERQETSKRNCAKEDDVLTSDIVLISGHSLSDDTDANDVIIEPHDFTRIASVDDENFEDEFDPILASIRKPPQTSATASAPSSTGKSSSDATIAGTGICDAPTVEEKKSDSRGSPNVGANFAAGLLSVFPEDMRARAGDMMVESSLRLSKSAGALRSALESGVPFVGNRSKRQREVDDGIELEDGRTGASSSRRTMGGRKDEDEENVRMLNVNEVLNEEERQQLAALSGGSGAASGNFFGCRRLRKYLPVVAGVALLGIIYLWRWRALPQNIGIAGGTGAVGQGGL